MNTRTRTRLSPEARKTQLLNVAKQMILDHGLQSFTMEALARAAGVSSPLVYNYFPNRKDTLRALLEQEYQLYSARLTDEVAAAENFEAVVRVFINSNLEHYAPGNIMPILDSQPEIASAIQDSQAKNGREIARFLVKNAAKNYRLTKAQAELVVAMSSGASIAAAQYASRRNANRKKVLETALSYVLAGLERIAKQSA